MKAGLAVGIAALACMGHTMAETCTPILKAAGAYAKAERYAVTMRIVSQGKTHDTEVMMAPEGMYLKAGDQWIRSPVSVDRSNLLDTSKSSFSDCTRIGEETINGVPTAIYRFTGKSEGEPAMTGKMWIGTADDLPRRLEGKTSDADITQAIRYDVESPKGNLLDIPGLDQLKGLFGK